MSDKPSTFNPSTPLTVQGFPLRTGPGGAYLPKTAQGIQSLAAWSNGNIERHDHWLIDEVARGFKKLLLLRLDGAPAAELVAMTAELWVDAIGHGLNAEQDAGRIRQGFTQLLIKSKRWPQPVELLGVLPTRMKAPSRSAAMEAPPSDEAHARGVAAFEEIMESLK